MFESNDFFTLHEIVNSYLDHNAPFTMKFYLLSRVISLFLNRPSFLGISELCGVYPFCASVLYG